jgi:hypothetical protein
VQISMKKERVLIAIKTYPTLSRKYGETVCTAGVREDGTWIRIYPVPFRRLDEAERRAEPVGDHWGIPHSARAPTRTL